MGTGDDTKHRATEEVDQAAGGGDSAITDEVEERERIRALAERIRKEASRAFSRDGSPRN